MLKFLKSLAYKLDGLIFNYLVKKKFILFYDYDSWVGYYDDDPYRNYEPEYEPTGSEWWADSIDIPDDMIDYQMDDFPVTASYDDFHVWRPIR